MPLRAGAGRRLLHRGRRGERHVRGSAPSSRPPTGASEAHLLAEVIATLGLLLVIFSLARTGRSATAPAAVGAYIGAAYFFTSSTSFANPAITIGRMFSDTFAGIAPASVPAFVIAQLVGGVVAIIAILSLYPEITPEEAATATFPRDAV